MNFNPRSPHGERPHLPRQQPHCADDFNPRSPHGERPSKSAKVLEKVNFNPRSPHGERRASRRNPGGLDLISIHAPRTGSDTIFIVPSLFDLISIHAPRTGSDAQARKMRLFLCNFNPRSPHGERRRGRVQDTSKKSFQSTLPARGATLRMPAERCWIKISIHAPRTGSDPRPPIALCRPCVISIHAPRTGSDPAVLRVVFLPFVFQSTLPARGATPVAAHQGVALLISIHAPRTGSDACRTRTAPAQCYFNPRSPHGERRSLPRAEGSIKIISIHAPRTGSDHFVPR